MESTSDKVLSVKDLEKRQDEKHVPPSDVCLNTLLPSTHFAHVSLHEAEAFRSPARVTMH